MYKTLCLDFGNTLLKTAVFEGHGLVSTRVLPDDSNQVVEQMLLEHQPRHSILSSVIHHDSRLEELLREHTRFHLLSHSSRLNFTTPVGKPSTIGADRLALAAAAVHFYPGKNSLVIGLGSCITYNFISRNQAFLGGSISPGMQMRYRSMSEFTAKLPLVEPDALVLRGNFPVTGYDTPTNLHSGVLAGMGFEMDGFIGHYRENYSDFNVVLTGGNAPYFARRLKNSIFADPSFLYKGLYALSEANNNC